MRLSRLSLLCDLFLFNIIKNLAIDIMCMILLIMLNLNHMCSFMIVVKGSVDFKQK